MSNVNHPAHYQSEDGLEVIDVIKAFTKDLSGVEAFDTANILKYACRWKMKGGIEDLEKIVWYATHLIEQLEERERKEEKENDLGVSFMQIPFVKPSKLKEV